MTDAANPFAQPEIDERVKILEAQADRFRNIIAKHADETTVRCGLGDDITEMPVLKMLLQLNPNPDDLLKLARGLAAIVDPLRREREISEQIAWTNWGRANPERAALLTAKFHDVNFTNE